LTLGGAINSTSLRRAALTLGGGSMPIPSRFERNRGKWGEPGTEKTKKK
jgi:hypothetical protein